MIRVWNKRAYKGSAKETQAMDGYGVRPENRTQARHGGDYFPHLSLCGSNTERSTSLPFTEKSP